MTGYALLYVNNPSLKVVGFDDFKEFENIKKVRRYHPASGGSETVYKVIPAQEDGVVKIKEGA